jgi:hypothetical protein
LSATSLSDFTSVVEPQAGGSSVSFSDNNNSVHPAMQQVPDGGSTILLLGTALSGLGLMVRRFKSGHGF